MLPAIWSGQEAFLGNLRELLASVFKRLGAVPPMGIGIVSVTRDGSPIQMSQIRSSGTIFDPHEQPQLAEATESTAKHMANSAARNISIHGASLRGFALAKEVRDALKDCDPRISRRSYVSEAVGLGTSDVVLWLEFDRAKHDRMPSVFMKSLLGTENVGLLQSAVEVILGRLCDELGKSDLWISGHRWEMKALAEDILREAGRHLMRRIRFSLTRSYGSSSLFDELNTLASIRYEQTEPMGGLVLEPVGSTAEPLFSSPVDLDDPAAARKMLQMARRPYWGLLRWSAIIGLAKRAPADPAEFRVQFRGQGRWDLLHGPKRLAQGKVGVPQVPARRLSRHRFARAFARTFPSNVTGVEKVWPLVQAAMRQGHGAMLVVAADASRPLMAPFLSIQMVSAMQSVSF